MRYHRLGHAALLFSLAALSPGLTTASGQQAPEEPPTRRLIVTFDGEGALPDSFTLEDFEIRGKGKQAPSRIYSRRELPAILVIALQEDLSAEFVERIPKLKEFILGLPQNMYVSVVRLTKDAHKKQLSLTPDHEEAARFLDNFALAKPPEAESEPPAETDDEEAGQEKSVPTRTSPYMELAGLVQQLAQLPPARAQVLFIGDGFDLPARGSNPRLKLALQNAQESGVPIWAVYHPAVPREQNTSEFRAVQIISASRADLVALEADFRSAVAASRAQFASGSDFLGILTRKSGGKFFSEKSENLKDRLAEFRRLLDRQWVLEYSSDKSTKKVKLLTKVPDTKLLAANR